MQECCAVDMGGAQSHSNTAGCVVPTVFVCAAPIGVQTAVLALSQGNAVKKSAGSGGSPDVASA